MVALKAEPMLAHDFTPLFRLEHMLKDVGLCLEESRAAGAPVPGGGRAPASSTPPASAAAWPTRTSPPCSRWSRRMAGTRI